MNQITVAYSGLHYINNHELLAPSIIIKSRDLKGESLCVHVHKDPGCVISGHQVLTNYDFVVSTEPQPDLVRNVVLPRYKKTTQAAQLATHVGQFPNFIPIHTWGASEATFNDAQLSYNVDCVIIKYEMGARGICQLLVKNVAKVNKSTIFKKFVQAMDSFRQKKLEITSAKEHNEALQAHFKNELPYTALWSGMDEQDFHHSLEFMVPGKYFMQEYISNIHTEYRVLVGVDNELHFFERGVREDRPFRQATGTNESIYSTDVKEVPETLKQEIRQFLLAAIPQMNSADLFLVNTPYGLRYGVIEYCNQFGMDTDDPSIFKTMHINFVLHYARKYRPDLFV